ncbi:MAG: phosphatase [Candidatus Pacearchaeota archaeon]|jgi:O-acetyl-ADP-ribose deacetylase (regulator of RNase III)|nr:phosphatase [Clostridia bacterium]
MKKAKVVIGNLIQDAKQFGAIAHGCNCFCRMGAGIALDVKNTFPQATAEDYKTIPGDIRKLGNYTNAVQKWQDGTETNIFNLYTQFGHNPADKPFVYPAFELALKKLSSVATLNDLSIGLPLIGYGLAGGELETIIAIIFKELKENDVTIYVWEGEKNAIGLKEYIEELLTQLESNFALGSYVSKQIKDHKATKGLF